MLQDPEGELKDWEDWVWAPNADTAWSRCEALALEFDPSGLTTVTNVSQTTKRPTKTGNYKFICWFKTEVEPNDNSNS